MQASVLISEMTHLEDTFGSFSEEALISDILESSTPLALSLIETYRGRVFATARKYARKESEVEDIVQEVSIRRPERWMVRMDAP